VVVDLREALSKNAIIMARSEKPVAKLGATAIVKAEASAKISYKRTKATTEVIPPDVTRAKSARWLDLISPITEWAGLKGDALRYRREQLRLQQEDVLLRIAKSVQDKMESQSTLQPISTKLLVPALEKASLEDAGDEFMVDLWANLLVSATAGAVPPRFPTIIGDLNSNQAKMFVAICERNMDKAQYRNSVLDETAYSLQQQYVENRLTELLRERSVSSDALYDGLEDQFALPGVALCDIIVIESDKRKYYSLPIVENDFGHADKQFDLQILASVGLLTKVDIHREVRDRRVKSVSIHYYCVTDLGCDFLRAVTNNRR
jgi:hypothetical protein